MIDYKMMGKRVKRRRKELGYTQEELSELLNISTEHLSRVETGSIHASLKLTERIADILSVSESELLFGIKSDGTPIAPPLSPEKQLALSEIAEIISRL